LPNPLYERVRVQLIDAEATVQSLTSRLATARADLARMEDLARAAPHVAAEYENLDRDYSILKKNYEEFLARRETSNITAAADTGADKVRLRIIDPPQVPTIPAAPNRMMLITLVLLGGLGSAGAVAVPLSRVDRSVGDIGHLRDLGFPVLGGISKIGGKEARSVGYGPQLRIAVMIIFLFMAYGGLAGHVSNIHWFI
ncbi:MAG TPA: hypothetical protein VGR71_02155, partial [Nitrospira sp.]|nr:hypothetical protein [Nitrospira sp.]